MKLEQEEQLSHLPRMMLRMSLDIVPRLADVDDDADRQQCF